MRNSLRSLKQLGIAFAVVANAGTASALEFFSATDSEVQNAQCRYPVVTGVQTIEKYFENKERQSDKNNFEFMGFKFINESPFYVKHFKDLIEPSENTAADKMPATVEKAKRTCSTVRCALATIFGKNESLKALYLLDKYRLNVAPMKYIQSGFFKDRDLDLILETMALVPPHLLPLSDIQQLSHVSTDGEKPADTYAESSIKIFDLWDQETPALKKYVLFHELAHNWSKLVAQDLDESEEWLKITGWKKISGGFAVFWEHPFQGKFTSYPWISKYSSGNAWEDFAEAVAAYRFIPERMEKTNPARYHFIKTKIFGNIEFKDNTNCQLKTRPQELAKVEDQALRLLDKKMNVYNEFTGDVDQVIVRDQLINACGLSLKNAILNKAGAIPQFHACVDKELSSQLATSYNWMNIDRQTEKLNVTFKKAKRSLIDQWLAETFMTENMQSVRWAPTKDYNCNAFAQNFKGLFMQQLELPNRQNKDLVAIKRELSPAIGYWICADSKTKNIKSAGVTKASFNSLKNWLYPRMSL